MTRLPRTEPARPRTPLLTAALAAVALTTLAPAGWAQIYNATLSGPAESPPNASPGVGFAKVTFTPLTQMLEVNVSFSGLLGTTTASHIHSPTTLPGTGTAIVATTTPSFLNFPLGVTSGTFDGFLDLTQASSYNPAFVTANGGTTAGAEAALLASMAAGTSYLNIHTTVVPGGEIRGFLTPGVAAVPEPSSLALLAMGLLPAGLLARKRRRGA